MARLALVGAQFLADAGVRLGVRLGEAEPGVDAGLAAGGVDRVGALAADDLRHQAADGPVAVQAALLDGAEEPPGVDDLHRLLAGQSGEVDGEPAEGGGRGGAGGADRQLAETGEPRVPAAQDQGVAEQDVPGVLLADVVGDGGPEGVVGQLQQGGHLGPGRDPEAALGDGLLDRVEDVPGGGVAAQRRDAQLGDAGGEEGRVLLGEGLAQPAQGGGAGGEQPALFQSLAVLATVVGGDAAGLVEADAHLAELPLDAPQPRVAQEGHPLGGDLQLPLGPDQRVGPVQMPFEAVQQPADGGRQPARGVGHGRGDEIAEVLLEPLHQHLGGQPRDIAQP
ncbi:hypothetical protein Salbus254_0370 [Streptomyces albidoflavus]|nr:hypothetical protein Salbus254_0370 [Streptomyces albidoflavus]